jgi:hypothetical protein
MFRDWFNCSEVDAFVDTIVVDLSKRFPPSGVELPVKKAIERLRRTQDVILRRVETFAATHALNLYKKAHLGNRFKWSLKEAGYPAEFVDALTYELVTVVALASRRRGPAAS